MIEGENLKICEISQNEMAESKQTGRNANLLWNGSESEFQYEMGQRRQFNVTMQ